MVKKIFLLGMLFFAFMVPVGLSALDVKRSDIVAQAQIRNFSVNVSGINRNGHTVRMQYLVRASSEADARKEGISRFNRANPGATNVNATVQAL